jgi:hypothetical protein
MMPIESAPTPMRAVDESGNRRLAAAALLACRGCTRDLEEVVRMTLYQMYFVDETDRIVLGEDVECVDDGAALRSARAALRHRDYPAVEVWDHAKRVGRAKRFDWIAPAWRSPEHRV